MIQKLDHRNPEVSENIRSVFQASYPYEAELLGAVDFPPLKRPLKEFINCDNDFIGYMVSGKLAAVMEVDSNKDSTLIQSLVVDPNYFRMGIGGRLITYVFHTYKTKVINVETGLANEPAVKLYKKWGFKEVKRYDTEYGVRKIRFENRIKD
jgi:ribosomal protein S18 acetylase RimI-like enzyme